MNNASINGVCNEGKPSKAAIQDIMHSTIMERNAIMIKRVHHVQRAACLAQQSIRGLHISLVQLRVLPLLRQLSSKAITVSNTTRQKQRCSKNVSWTFLGYLCSYEEWPK